MEVGGLLQSSKGDGLPGLTNYAAHERLSVGQLHAFARVAVPGGADERHEGQEAPEVFIDFRRDAADYILARFFESSSKTVPRNASTAPFRAASGTPLETYSPTTVTPVSLPLGV